MKRAEASIYKYAQHKEYPSEIQRLEHSSNGADACHKVKRSSTLYTLVPIINDDGVLGVKSRLRNSRLPRVKRYPVILPPNHPVTHLIVRYYHEISGHSHREHLLGLLRERFWLIKARSTIRRLLARCVTCKRLYARPNFQLMRDLQQSRLTRQTSIHICRCCLFLTITRPKGTQPDQRIWLNLYMLYS